MANVNKKTEKTTEPNPVILKQIIDQLEKGIKNKRIGKNIQTGNVILGDYDNFDYAWDKENELKYLKGKNVIVSYKLEKYEPDDSQLVEERYFDPIDYLQQINEAHLKDVNYILLRAKCKFYPKKIAEFLKNFQVNNSPIFDLRLDYNEKTREIKINNILIARPDFESSNDSIIAFLFENDGKVFLKSELKEELKREIKPFNNFLNDIKIKGALRKYLFNVAKQKIRLIKQVTVIDPIDITKLKNELGNFKNGNR